MVIVDLDEESLKAKGQWPWPRTLVAQLIDNLTRYQVAAIGFDIVFAETDRTSPAIIAPLLPGLDPETRDKLAPRKPRAGLADAGGVGARQFWLQPALIAPTLLFGNGFIRDRSERGCPLGRSGC